MTQRQRACPSRQRQLDQAKTPLQRLTGQLQRREFRCRAANPFTLPRCRHAAVGRITTVLHLAEQQKTTPLRHEIDLAGMSAPTPCKNAMSGQSQI